MPYLPSFIAPARFTDPAAALARVREIYDSSLCHLREAMKRFVAGETMPGHVRACYPFVRVQTDTVTRLGNSESARLSYGFVAGPGRFETTLSRPDLYADYYLEQFTLLLQNHEVELDVGTSSQPIPVHFSFAEHDHIEGSLSQTRRQLMRLTCLIWLPWTTALPTAPLSHHPVSPCRCRCSPRPGLTIRCTVCGITPAPRQSTFRISCCSPITSSTLTSLSALAMPP